MNNSNTRSLNLGGRRHTATRGLAIAAIALMSATANAAETGTPDSYIPFVQSSGYPAYVDAGHLGAKAENKAIGLFSHSGVANHPGDLGMRRLADLILAAFAAQREAQKQGKTLPYMSDGDSCEVSVSDWRAVSDTPRQFPGGL